MGRVLNTGESWIDLGQAREALVRGTGRGIRIAVLDSGIETSHPTLGGLALCDDLAIVSDGVQLVVQPGGGRDVFGHGTAIAGILRTVAPDVEISSIRVLGDGLVSRTAIIREGARQALDRGCHILNCSFGCGMPDHVLQYKCWVDEAYLQKVHVVAACHNGDCNKQEWPAHFSSVISVDMADAPGDALFYRGGSLVEFLAHGVNVPVPWRDGATKNITGSSFAAARVSGLLARLLSGVPDLSPLQAKALLQHLAGPWPET